MTTHTRPPTLGPLLAAPTCIPTRQAGWDSNMAVGDTLAQVGATRAAEVPGTETPSWPCFTRGPLPDPRVWKLKTQEATREASVAQTHHPQRSSLTRGRGRIHGRSEVRRWVFSSERPQEA